MTVQLIFENFVQPQQLPSLSCRQPWFLKNQLATIFCFPQYTYMFLSTMNVEIFGKMLSFVFPATMGFSQVGLLQNLPCTMRIKLTIENLRKKAFNFLRHHWIYSASLCNFCVRY